MAKKTKGTYHLKDFGGGAQGKRSSFEVEVESSLLTKVPKRSLEYETELLEYFVPKFYKPDFIIRSKPKDIYIEAKGFFTPSDRTKLLAVKEAHPDLDIRLLFQRDNWLTKAHKQRYSDWARKNGFPFSIYPELPL
jgi:predicted nuclease of restriction endonuclease-like RecB superfamily